MPDKLDTGDTFPELTLQVLDRGAMTLPRDLAGRYNVVLFYRGHW